MPKLNTKLATEFTSNTRALWLWEPYLPAGRITVLDGDPGLGKSFITMDLCARITAGAPFPNQPPTSRRDPRNVLICNCEDERTTTMVPRLQAAGADLGRVVFGECVVDSVDPFRLLRLPSDKSALAAACRDFRPALIVIDPVLAFLDDNVKSNSDQSVRTALNCLNAIAEESQAAVLLVRHLTKKQGTKAIYRGGGAIGILGLARSGLLVAKNPDDPSQTLLLHMKSNMAARGTSLAFELRFRGAAGGVVWKGKSDITPDQALREMTPPTAVEKAVQFLRAALEGGKEMRVTDLIAAARLVGVSPKVLTTAGKRLLVFRRQKFDGLRNGWYWSLRAAEPDPLDEIMRMLPLR